MEGNRDLRTVVECLRGRLLAERQASRTAKHDSQRFEYKLVELEKMVKQEMKLRNKAEKRLKSLKKKLETLNISFESQSDKSSSGSDKSEISSSVSSTITSTSSTSESDFNSNVTNSATSSQQDSSSTHEDFDNIKSPQDFSPKSHCQNRCEDEEYDVDDSLALALVPNSVSECEEIESSSVEQVLDSLRYIRETIQSSLEVRRMVRVGPN